MRPASEQMALISAPERSSFWLMNSSRSTSSFSDIFEVCSVKIFFFVASANALVCLIGFISARLLTVGILEENLSVNATRADKGWIQGLNLVSGHDNFYITAVVKAIKLDTISGVESEPFRSFVASPKALASFEWYCDCLR